MNKDLLGVFALFTVKRARPGEIKPSLFGTVTWLFLGRPARRMWPCPGFCRGYKPLPIQCLEAWDEMFSQTYIHTQVYCCVYMLSVGHAYGSPRPMSHSSRLASLQISCQHFLPPSHALLHLSSTDYSSLCVSLLFIMFLIEDFLRVTQVVRV